eukprot:3667905-Prymnesium_polylepis.1
MYAGAPYAASKNKSSCGKCVATKRRKASLETSLKALRKSTFTTTQRGFASKARRTVDAKISTPRETPTPSCGGPSRSPNSPP